jgi:Rrf2 family protein
MLKITKEVEYALIALKFMHEARPGQIISAREVCDDKNLPFDATSRTMQKLAKRHILKSNQGKAGGYQLVADLSRVSVYDFMDAAVGPVELAKCLGVKCGCQLVETCNIISPMTVLNNKLIDFYKSINLRDLFDSRSSDEADIKERYRQKMQNAKIAG